MGASLKGAAAGLLAAALLACGGGDNSFVGLGNSGNRIFNDDLDELAEQLHGWPGVPQVEDRDLARIYQALVQRAREGEPSAARVVLALAELQREAREARSD
jgi:hypothetical protein